MQSAGGDQVPFAGFLGDRDGDGADQGGGGGKERDPEQSVAGGGARDEGGGDERGETAAEGGGQLVAQRCSGVTVSGGEDLGGERSERPVHGGLHQRHGDDKSEKNAEDVAGGDEQQDRVDRDDRGDTAGDHDGSAADPVGQCGVGG